MPVLGFKENKYGTLTCVTPKGSMLQVGKSKAGLYYWFMKSPEEIASTVDFNYSPKIIGKDPVDESHPDGFGSQEACIDNMIKTLNEVYKKSFTIKIEKHKDG